MDTEVIKKSEVKTKSNSQWAKIYSQLKQIGDDEGIKIRPKDGQDIHKFANNARQGIKGLIKRYKDDFSISIRHYEDEDGAYLLVSRK